MGLERFEIVFDNPQAVFYAGQTVTGRIVVINSTPKCFRGINVKLKGRAEVNWSEVTEQASSPRPTNHRNTNEVTEIFSSEETYFETQFNVLGSGEDVNLNPGEHFYPFNYVLPSNLPSSFKGDYGHVRYTILAVVDRPWKFDYEAKAAFTVISPLDLNADPKLAAPLSKEKIKIFCCMCCTSAPVYATLSLPCGGVVPGESLAPTVEVDNKSRVSISQIKLQLIKTVTYKARGGNDKKCKVSIAEKYLPKVKRGASEVFVREAGMQIPPMPPSNLDNCSIIDLDYHLNAYFVTSGFHFDFEMRLPVVVGTIPFSANFGQFNAPQAAENIMPVGWNFSPSAPQLDEAPNYPDMPPPSYEESVFGAKSIQEKSDNQYMFMNKNFAPMYPVYRQS
ncbi:arrestin domain-containing protein 17-like [Neocloeon triangulifer]|uniref:arrestin domain-containing protein 17-like n=1 Tax=Neocloeon triangulifer TaxID=2078957 RepID=UPI00286FA4FA|nr:arrestin domain-containing protein 17-like [Neocloeon triangulifer]